MSSLTRAGPLENLVWSHLPKSAERPVPYVSGTFPVKSTERSMDVPFYLKDRLNNARLIMSDS